MADNYEFIHCPACGKLMKKIFLEEHQFMVDVCLDGCGGIWLDNREYKKIDEKHESIAELTPAYEGKTFKKVDDTEDRECPICHSKMVKNFTSPTQEIIIDECYNCGGKFLDYKELEKIRAEYENDEVRTQATIEYFKSLKRDQLKYGFVDTNDL